MPSLFSCFRPSPPPKLPQRSPSSSSRSVKSSKPLYNTDGGDDTFNSSRDVLNNNLGEDVGPSHLAPSYQDVLIPNRIVWSPHSNSEFVSDTFEPYTDDIDNTLVKLAGFYPRDSKPVYNPSLFKPENDTVTDRITASGVSSPDNSEYYSPEKHSSPETYKDFRKSMQEMVDDKFPNKESLNHEEVAEYLKELLTCFLALNPEDTHEVILMAHSDIIEYIEVPSKQDTLPN